MSEYWKDNLGVELDILKRENGVPRRYDAQLYGMILASWIPDPSRIVINLLPDHFFPEYMPPHTGALASPPPCARRVRVFAATGRSGTVCRLPGGRGRVPGKGLQHSNQGSRPGQVGRPAVAPRVREQLQRRLQHADDGLRRAALAPRTWGGRRGPVQICRDAALYEQLRMLLAAHREGGFQTRRYGWQSTACPKRNGIGLAVAGAGHRAGFGAATRTRGRRGARGAA